MSTTAAANTNANLQGLAWPPLVYAALAAFLTCLCDTGGPIRQRVPTLLAFTLAGALTWGGFGVLRGAGLAVALPLAGAGIFVASFARVWGVPASAAGNLLSVVLILALDAPLSWRAALLVGGMFVAGGLWATLLTMAVWRLHPYRPARLAVAEAWRRLAALLVLSRAIAADKPVHLARLERALATVLAAAAPDPALARVTAALTDRLRIAAKLSTPGGTLLGDAAEGEAAPPWWDRVRAPVLANLTWDSAMLRHALRTAVVATPALAVTQIWGGRFAHWLPITVVVTLQPFYAATWQRTLERAGGTVLGGLAGAALAFAARTPGLLAALMFPLCTVAFAARQVSYGTYIACVTPIVVVLIELVEPGQSAWTVAGLRALFVVAGGAVAVLGWLLLWPSWEPGRLRREQEAALAAHARYAQAAMAELLGEGGTAATEAARRGAGVATNNLEASLARALQEPRRSQRRRLQAAMVVDATLRRIAGQLSALRHDPTARAALDAAAWGRWRDWIAAALVAAAEGGVPAAARPEGAAPDPLSRIARQVELLEGALRRSP